MKGTILTMNLRSQHVSNTSSFKSKNEKYEKVNRFLLAILAFAVVSISFTS